MNLLKIQQDLLKVIFKKGPEKINYFVDDLYDRTFVIPDPLYVGYMIPNEKLRIDLSGAQQMLKDVGKLQETADYGYKLTGTDEYRHGGNARKYLRPYDKDMISVYVSKSLLKYFDDSAELRQLPGSPLQPIAVLEDRLGDGDLTIAGLVMPCRVKETEEDNK